MKNNINNFLKTLEKTNIELNDLIDIDKIIEIIAKEVKGKKDALVEFEKGGRDDLIEQTNKEERG